MTTKRFWAPAFEDRGQDPGQDRVQDRVDNRDLDRRDDRDDRSEAGRDDRRSMRRQPVDFYAIELANGARYLRRICNVSSGGLLMEDRLTFQKPGSIVRIQLPRLDRSPVTVNAEVVRVTRDGGVALRALEGAALEGLGGVLDL
jgi:hypothetical protein